MHFPIISVPVIFHHFFRLNNIIWGKKKKSYFEEKAQDNTKDYLGILETITKWGRFVVHHNKWANLKQDITDTSYLNKRLLNNYLCFCFKKSGFSLKL